MNTGWIFGLRVRVGSRWRSAGSVGDPCCSLWSQTLAFSGCCWAWTSCPIPWLSSLHEHSSLHEGTQPYNVVKLCWHTNNSPAEVLCQGPRHPEQLSTAKHKTCVYCPWPQIHKLPNNSKNWVNHKVTWNWIEDHSPCSRYILCHNLPHFTLKMFIVTESWKWSENQASTLSSFVIY